MIATDPFPLEFYRDQSFASIILDGGSVNDREFLHCAFFNCSFQQTLFARCRFEDCTFDQCNLSVFKSMNSGFLGVKFEQSKLLGVDWTRVKTPIDVSFHWCILDNCLFPGLKLKSTKMLQCKIREADFTKADLSSSSFGSSDLAGTQFIQCNLSKCDFDSADLAGARFFDCDLSFADFSKARNYTINPTANKLKKTQFSLPEAASLLSVFDIVLK